MATAGAHAQEPTPGPATSSPASDVELTLSTSRATLIAGDTWTVAGMVSNHSKAPLWITDAKSSLLLPPDLFGAGSDDISLPAYFLQFDYNLAEHYLTPGSRWDCGQPGNGDCETIVRRKDRILKVEAGSRLPLLWYIRYSELRSPSSAERRLPFLTATTEVPVDGSPWALILGAAVGSTLSFCYLVVQGAVRPAEGLAPGRTLLWALTGLVAATLLAVSVTVLLSRLVTTEFPVAVQVRDFWAALAGGRRGGTGGGVARRPGPAVGARPLRGRPAIVTANA
jgi:hypothetical protein